MSLKPVLFSILTTMLLLPVVQAEESPAETAPAAESPSSMEERVRAYREQFDQQVKKAELLRQEHQAEMDELRDERQAEMQETRDEHQAEMEAVREERQAEMDSMRVQRPMQRQRPVSGNQMAMQKYLDAQRLEQEALAAKWREARQKQQEARQKQQEAQLDAFLKEREERLLSVIKRQEEMRNRAEERHNYLVENQDEIMEGLREEQVDIASRHEEQRLRAEERRKKMTAMRLAMEGMTPQERSVYMQEHQAELFGPQGDARPNMRPNMRPDTRGGQGRPPFPPPWMQQAPDTVPPAPQP